MEQEISCINLDDFIQKIDNPNIYTNLVYLKNYNIIDKLIFGGSFTLKLHGLINRPINDLDILSLENLKYTNILSKYRLFKLIKYNMRSPYRWIPNIKTDTWSACIFNIKLDIIYHTHLIKYKTIKILNKDDTYISINVALPEIAIYYKLLYLQTNINSACKKKHIEDLVNLNILNKYHLDENISKDIDFKLNLIEINNKLMNIY